MASAVATTGSDDLHGGTGADKLEAQDNIAGNDLLDGGVDTDSDSCCADPGDTVVNCP